MYKTNYWKLLLSSTLALEGLMRTVCIQRVILAKRCSLALYVRNTLCIRYQLATLFIVWSQIVFLIFFMGGLCVVYVWLGQTSVNENTTNLERVLYLCLTLDWRWSDVLLASYTFTRGKTLTFLSMHKMCAEVDAHNKWMTFIRRSRQIINEFWRTPSESQRTDKNSSFFCALDVRDGMCDWAFNCV